MSVLSVFGNILPPPRYMSLPSVGVDISDTSLKYIEFKPHNKGGITHSLSAWGEIDIPIGVLQRGQVLDPKKLTGVLVEFKQRTKSEYIRVSLPEERAYLFETEIKRSTPEKEVRSILEFRLEENVPIPAREAFFGYDIIDSVANEKNLRVVVAAYARETILNYYDACAAAQLTPISFEVEAQAMVRSVLPTDVEGAHMLVDFGKTRTGVGIVYNGSLMYTSTIDFGGGQLSDVLRKELGMVSESELTRIKNTEGLIRGVKDTRVYDALISTISVIKDELASRIQYWHDRDYEQRERRIQSVILCGGSANLKGLPEYLSEVLHVPTVRANVWQNAFSTEAYIPPIDLRFSYGYATAIGLALGTRV
jgi:type IV pilus assembly protein PilM